MEQPSQSGRINVCDDALRDHPGLRMLEERLQQPGPFDFASELAALRSAVESSFALDALKVGLRNIQRSCHYQLPQFTSDERIKGWTIAVSEHFAISVGMRGAVKPLAFGATHEAGPAPRIQPYPFDMFVKFLRVDKVELERYEVRPRPRFHEPELIHTGTDMLGSGDSLFMRAGIDASTSTLDGPVVYIEIAGKMKARVLPQFDFVTKEFCGWISGDPMACRIELLTRTLADFGRSDAAPLLSTLGTSHADHFVRWNSIRHLLRLDPHLGIPAARRAIHDPHPDVRDAATATLRLIENSAV